MAKTHKVHKKTTAVLALIFLIPALYIFVLWLKVFTLNSDLNQAEKVEVFTGYFPKGLNNVKIITFFSMACCIVAMVLAAKSFKHRLILLRIMMFVTVIAAALIFILDLSQLM